MFALTRSSLQVGTRRARETRFAACIQEATCVPGSPIEHRSGCRRQRRRRKRPRCATTTAQMPAAGFSDRRRRTPCCRSSTEVRVRNAACGRYSGHRASTSVWPPIRASPGRVRIWQGPPRAQRSEHEAPLPAGPTQGATPTRETHRPPAATHRPRRSQCGERAGASRGRRAVRRHGGDKRPRSRGVARELQRPACYARARCFGLSFAG